MFDASGRLIGKTRTTSLSASVPGLWTMQQQIEARRASLWPLSGSSFVGGDTEYDINIEGISYRVHVFTSLGTSNLTVIENGVVDYLIVAGGGGGGAVYGGGGGGGGVLMGTNLEVTSGIYEVLVGAGGSSFPDSGNVTGDQGGNSSIFDLVAIGGGGGAHANSTASSGGSGGGGAGLPSSFGGSPIGAAGTTGQGYKGGNGAGTTSGVRGAGGGGGAGAAGGNGTTGVGGAGGNGIQSSITGETLYYGGGGGGGTFSNNSVTYAGGLGGGGRSAAHTVAAQAGTDGLGGGGGGGAQQSSSPNAVEYGAKGGSGIVIIRYALS